MNLLDYHVLAFTAPLKPDSDGVPHVVLPDIPAHMDMHVGPITIDPETGGPAVVLFFAETREAASQETPDGPKLELVTD